MVTTEPYRIVWQECVSQSDVAKRFYVPDFEGYLPFFFSGSDLETLERKERVELREEQLLKGILYSLDDYLNRQNPRQTEECRKVYLYLLDVLRKGFGFDNVEKMILDVAFDIKRRNGNYPASAILKVGHGLVPNSSKIISDYICRLWAVAADGNGNDELFENIIGLMDKLDLDDIHPTAKEAVCYYGFCAMYMSSKHYDSDSYLEKFIYPHVTIPELKQKIVEMFEKPGTYTAADLKLREVE